jgi:tetratricopeptide (TPR) repeat protein
MQCDHKPTMRRKRLDLSAVVQVFYEWDWLAAEQACKRAISLSPNLALAHSVWSDWLFIMGRHKEAMAEAHLAVELDPLSAGLNVRLAHKLHLMDNNDRLGTNTKSSGTRPQLLVQPHTPRTCLRLEESLATCEKVASLYRGSPFSRALRSLILALAAKTDEAKKIVNELKKQPRLDPLSLISLAETYSVIGEKTEAFEFLEAAYQERVGVMIFLDSIPNFKNIRADPRYADLLRRMGLPQSPLPTPSSKKPRRST